jgi:hypothetical protein
MPRLPVDEEIAAARTLAGRLGLGEVEPVVLSSCAVRRPHPVLLNQMWRMM